MTRRIRNLCSGCGCDFSSVAAFDRHRVGRFEYDYSRGLKMSPPREDGRRCMSADEMSEAGMSVNRDGRWQIDAQVESGRRLRQSQNTRYALTPSAESASELDDDSYIGWAAWAP